MPVILSPQHYDRWLDPEIEDAAGLQPLLQPDPADEMLDPSDEMTVEPVSTHVNRPANDDPRCIEVQRELF
jgi:putative SOS response-associated peptidase YedK